MQTTQPPNFFTLNFRFFTQPGDLGNPLARNARNSLNNFLGFFMLIAQYRPNKRSASNVMLLKQNLTQELGQQTIVALGALVTNIHVSQTQCFLNQSNVFI